MNPSSTMISSIARGPRQSNMELLRIVAMFLILLLHANGFSSPLPTGKTLAAAPVTGLARLALQTVSVVSVDVFVLISGWFGIRASVRGFMNFAVQCLFWSVGLWLLFAVAWKGALSAKGLASAVYFTSDCWFVKSYVVLYLLSPILNAFIERASRAQMLLILTFFYLFQTLYGWLGDLSYFQQGYSPLAFIGLYLLAAFAHKHLNNKLLQIGGG